MPNWSVTNTFVNATASDATQVNQNFTDIINASSDGTKNMSISALTLGGVLTTNNNVILGDTSVRTLTVNASLASSIPIGTTFTYDIGSATIGLRSIYLGDAGSNARSTHIIGATVASSWSLTLPTGVGTSGYVLSTDGAGVTSWIDRRVVPTIQKFTSGSGTYTTPANVMWIRVRLVGGGGGGGGSGAGGGTGTTGGNTTFGTTLLAANGGVGGARGGTTGGAGGSASLGTGPIGIALTGATGNNESDLASGASGGGGSSPFGGAGPATVANGTASSAISNTGSGGSGGYNTSGNNSGGGGAGGYVDAIITAPAASYAYAVGAVGTGGIAGTSGNAGGAGGSGLILVEEHYQ